MSTIIKQDINQKTVQNLSAIAENGSKGISMPAVPVIQNKEEENDLLAEAAPQLKSTAQLVNAEEETQLKTTTSFQLKANNTGMPDQLKSGVENLSGMDMSDVKVHYNSSQPSQLQALAYAQGNEIHIGPGQEKHLPHEAWHVVQQRQGRVQATKQMKQGVAVNDDPGLENEADVMGAKSMTNPLPVLQPKSNNNIMPDVVQRVINVLQPLGNLCWAAAGYAIHIEKRGQAMTLQQFVTNFGSAAAGVAFANNTVLDIDEIIGGAGADYLTAVDVDPNGYAKRTFTVRLPGSPMVACIGALNGGHYVVLESYAEVQGGLNITYMDPLDGLHHTVLSPTNNLNRITSVGGHAIFALYFT